ncbi:MAG: hypothetical protein KDA80_00110 [Planctomycetaceae bacterium]|nr:hypothetical protein [Planctomycetaceae bacterium]
MFATQSFDRIVHDIQSLELDVFASEAAARSQPACRADSLPEVAYLGDLETAVSLSTSGGELAASRLMHHIPRLRPQTRPTSLEIAVKMVEYAAPIKVPRVLIYRVY